MESTKLSALLVLAMLALSSPLALAREMAFQPECNSCQTGTPSSGTPSGGGVSLPPVTLPPVSVPKLPSLPIPLSPIISKPPISLPPVLGSPVTVPPVLGGGSPVTVPPVLGIPLPVPPVTGLPPVTLPPVSVPPILGGSGSPPKVGHHHGGRKACPPPPSPPTPTPTPTPTPSSDTCPIDALKLGACVDLLGNEVHIGNANVQCCPLVKGIAGLSAAACLCTAIKAKVLDLSVYVPIALKVLVNCGCAVPPGYDCA